MSWLPVGTVPSGAPSLATCSLDITSSTSFIRCLKTLRKSFRNVDLDLQKVKPLIERDHTKNCNATRLKMTIPSLQGLVFKYDFGSIDMRKHPRDSFRLVGLFLRDPTSTTEGPTPILYSVLCYHRANQDFVSSKDIAVCLSQLQSALRGTEDS